MKQSTKDQLKKQLNKDEYAVIVNKATEAAHTGSYNLHFEDGIYHCKACDEKLFLSSGKFNAGCGWPSFDKEIESNKIKKNLDESHGMSRTEIACTSCGGHLGHIFNDGPTSTGLRYCVNSLSLDFKKK
ncbi:MAG: peptide-methionine (R)-S-oxide reductase MsrB [Proteobacteria bacterium]|nr:peptide-methionine (R)-S-oxide reductase MsrB [Pseudomonadota bacterium]